MEFFFFIFFYNVATLDASMTCCSFKNHSRDISSSKKISVPGAVPYELSVNQFYWSMVSSRLRFSFRIGIAQIIKEKKVEVKVKLNMVKYRLEGAVGFLLGYK